MSSHETKHQPSDQSVRDDALILPLETLDRTLLPMAGGKATQLGELIRAGFAVPAGFCVTTAAHTHVSASAGLDALLTELSSVPQADTARQTELAAAARTAILHAPVSSDIASTIAEAYG